MVQSELGQGHFQKILYSTFLIVYLLKYRELSSLVGQYIYFLSLN